MYVKISGFKCHLDTTYNITPTSMILLKGKSGTGKSTVLQAIFWALYGGLRGVYNNKGLVKTCSVTLKINQLVIYRQKRPELLQVTILDKEEKTYEDAVAQQIINQAFGPKDLWKSCSYIVQKKRCALLSGSASERLDLLNQLSFNTDTPKDYINRIDQELKTVNKEFLFVQGEFTAEINMYSQQLTTLPVTVSLSDSDILDLENNIKMTEPQLEGLYQEVLTHERNIGSYNMISSQIKTYQSQLDQLKSISYDETTYITQKKILEDNIENLKSKLTDVQAYQKIIADVTSLQNQIKDEKSKLISINNSINQIHLDDQYNSISNSDQPITQQMVWEAQNQESNRAKYVQMCNQIQCDYDSHTIRDKINRLQTELNKHHEIMRNIQIYDQWKSLQSQLSRWDPSHLDTNYITTLEQNNRQTSLEISELTKGLELLRCPSCHVSLRYMGNNTGNNTGNKLVPGEIEPVSPSAIRIKEQEYKSVTDEINKIRYALQLKQQMEALGNQMSNVDLKELETYRQNPPNLTNHQSMIGQLHQIQIIDAPSVSSSYLAGVLNYQNLTHKLRELNSHKNNIEENIRQLQIKLDTIKIPDSPSDDSLAMNKMLEKYKSDLIKLQQQYQEYQNRLSTIHSMETTLNGLYSQINTIQSSLNPTAKNVYESTKTFLAETKIKYDDAVYGRTMRQQQQELEKKREEVLSLNTDLISLGKLKQAAINVECKQLQDTVDNINLVLTDILPLFFTDPIDMHLRLYKEMKTKAQVKPGLNIYIKYNEVEYDDIDQLSGGEGDRISLALVLALNQVSNSPVVLLDECISSLDGALKESCISAMKTLRGKTIICVDHEGVEGYYDNVIEVNNQSSDN